MTFTKLLSYLFLIKIYKVSTVVHAIRFYLSFCQHTINYAAASLPNNTGLNNSVRNNFSLLSNLQFWPNFVVNNCLSAMHSSIKENINRLHCLYYLFVCLSSWFATNYCQQTEFWRICGFIWLDLNQLIVWLLIRLAVRLSSKIISVFHTYISIQWYKPKIDQAPCM